ncbi:hypothetical protein [Acinetobacter sp. RF14B]|uniref:hypothetical protein n=1 Tax=Acinetobacter sp. RF14B TaxID=2650965 RepID=UPI0011743D47|nr:hypothetical protein [Acinetobacter sp. RF14B]TQR72802.1 hypothetical protein E2K52_00455 [Acinetobacter sp. RF14B]
MSSIIHQALITDSNSTNWGKDFTQKHFSYLKNVINGLIRSGAGYDDVAIEVDGSTNTLHIYEPFSALNYLGYGSPSVVSIRLNEDKVQFLTGDDNGLGLGSSRLLELEPIKLLRLAFEVQHHVVAIIPDSDF